MKQVHPPDEQAYNKQVWGLARQIPYSYVATYGQIAKLIPPPNGIASEDYQAFGPRWVGNAMAACPIDVPWQRVINSQGKISDRPGAQQQRRLLEDEGILFKKDKIDLKVYQWNGPDKEQKPRQKRLF